MASDRESLRLRVEKRVLSLVEIPLALVDSSTEQRIPGLAMVRERVADRVRKLDEILRGASEEATFTRDDTPFSVHDHDHEHDHRHDHSHDHRHDHSHDHGHSHEPAPVKAEAPKAEPVKAEAPQAETKVEAPKAEAPQAEKAEAKPAVKVEPKTEAPKAEAAPRAAKPAAEPVAGYADMNVHKAVKLVRGAEEPLLAKIEAYERANSDRKTVLSAIEARRERLSDPTMAKGPAGHK